MACKLVVISFTETIFDVVKFVNRAFPIVPVAIFNSFKARLPNVADAAFKLEIRTLLNVELVFIKSETLIEELLTLLEKRFEILDVVATKFPVVIELIFILPTVKADIIELDSVDVVEDKLSTAPELAVSEDAVIFVAFICPELINDDPNVILSIDETTKFPVVMLLNFALLDEILVVKIVFEVKLFELMFVIIAASLDRFDESMFVDEILLVVKFVILLLELLKLVRRAFAEVKLELDMLRDCKFVMEELVKIEFVRDELVKTVFVDVIAFELIDELLTFVKTELYDVKFVVLVFGVMSEDVDKLVALRFVVELLVEITLVVEILEEIIFDVFKVFDTILFDDTLVFIKLVIVAVGAEKIFEMRRLDVVSELV